MALSWGNLADLATNIGVPSTAVIAVIFAFELGWMPFETQHSKTYDQAQIISQSSQDSLRLTREVINQHSEQLRQNERHLEHLLAALREVCFNTAKTEDRQRACGQLIK